MEENAVSNVNPEKVEKDKDMKEKYKSSKLILEYVYKEYTRENERRKNIESRITILITISIFLGGLIIINNQIDFISMLNNEDKMLYLFIALQVLSCVSLLGAMVAFVSILVAREYRSISIDNFTQLKPQGSEEGIVAYDLIKIYKECCDFNKVVNDSKFKINNIGIILLLSSIILYLLLRIIDICT